VNKAYRLAKNSAYQRVYRRGRSAAMPLAVLIYTRGREKKAGFSVSKKVGKAVVRNRVRRRMKEATRLLMPRIKEGAQFILVARPDAAQASYTELERTIEKLLKRAKLLKEVEGPQ
jgi:ribonuclease P protein component